MTQKSSKWLAIYLRSLECLLKLIRPPIFGKFGQFSWFGSKDLATYPAKLTKTLKTPVLVIVMYCWALILSSIWAQIRRSSLHGCYLCARDVAAEGINCALLLGSLVLRTETEKYHTICLFSLDPLAFLALRVRAPKPAWALPQRQLFNALVLHCRRYVFELEKGFTATPAHG